MAGGDLSVVQILANTASIWSVSIGVIFFTEKLAKGEWIGLGFILAGAAMVSLTHESTGSHDPVFVMLTGIVALVLQADPSLTPDDVKCRLVASTHTAMNADGSPAYSVFQQGAGLVNAYDAVFSTATGTPSLNSIAILVGISGAISGAMVLVNT